MKLKRTMSALLAGVIAVSSSVVCSVSAGAAGQDLLTGEVDVKSGKFDERSYIIGDLYNAETKLDIGDYVSATLTYDVVKKGNIISLALFANGSSYVQKYADDVTEGNDKTVTVGLANFGDTISKIGYMIDGGLGNENAELTGEIKFKSLVLNSNSSAGEDDKPTAVKGDYFLEYDGSPIVMTADGNGGATCTFDLKPEGITLGESTIGDLKAKFGKLGMKGIKYVSDTLGLSAENFGASVFVQSGSDWQYWSAQGFTGLTADGIDVTFDTSSIEAWDNTASENITVPDDAVIREMGVQIYVGDPKPSEVKALKNGETFTINPASTTPGEGDEPVADESEVLWTGSTALGNWAETVSLDNMNLAAGDTINIEYTVNEANAQLKVCAKVGSWESLASLTGTNEYGVVDLANDGTYSFVINEADAKAVNEAGMGIQGQNATITKVTVTKAASGDDDGDYIESTIDYTKEEKFSVIKLFGTKSLVVFPITKAQADNYNTACITITRNSDGKTIRSATDKVYKGFKFVDENNNKVKESGVNGTYFVIFVLDNYNDDDDYAIELNLFNAVG